jgi:malto-oligosyltrehalose trehalohydrolase/4-alpha-glucanotransferase
MQASKLDLFGAIPNRNGTTTVRVWAPALAHVRVRSPDGDEWALKPAAGGWHEADLPLPAGSAYRFVLPDDVEVPDPASRQQSGDVHDYSLVVDHSAYRWKATAWRGRPWHETVLYELHTGLLGGFEGVEAKLPELAALGITAVELMPVSDFPGPRNWGYDGVLPFAPDSAYGTPEQLKHLVDTAHGLGLMVFLDVVYNHFGPDGNYLSVMAPEFFRDDVHTLWGSAIDFRRPEVRSFFTANAVQWVIDYRFDGLRLDAVHAITESDWLDEMARAVRAAAGPDRHVHLVLENDDNNAAHLEPARRCFDAQWNDDAHHVLHVLLTGEKDGYYADYSDNPAARLARVMAEGFTYQGEPSAHRQGEKRGTFSGHLPPTAFVDCLQNHDQVGNRPMGDRLTSLADPATLKAATALLLLSPHIPLIFMGEEIGSCDPFLYFTSHEPELAELVKEGRRKEFAGFSEFADEDSRERIPDPNDPETFISSRPVAMSTAHGHRALYQTLLRLRAEHVMPGLAHCSSSGSRALGDRAAVASWRLGTGKELVIATNLGKSVVEWHDAPRQGTLLYSTQRFADPRALPARCTAVYLTTPIPMQLSTLALEAGVQTEWHDYLGRPKFVSEKNIRVLLSALGHSNERDEDIRRSLDALRAASKAPTFITGRAGESVQVRLPADLAGHVDSALLVLETGISREICAHARTSDDGLLTLMLDPIAEPGYHQLHLRTGDWQHHVRLAIAQQRAYAGPDGRHWGTAVQVYSLRAELERGALDTGTGDYSSLAVFAHRAAEAGAQALAVSPTHAGFAAEPLKFSPYSPSSRLFYNVVYIDPVAEFGIAAAESALDAASLRQTIEDLQHFAHIDWERSGRAKLKWLRAIHEARPRQYLACEGGLLMHATFEALHAHFVERGMPDWRNWPEAFRNPHSLEVARFRVAHEDDVRFHAWLQTLASNGLARAKEAAISGGMRIGLIADLAVGMAADGGHAWAAQRHVLTSLEIGAPPDLLNPSGQAWGLTTFSAQGLRNSDFEPFIATLRAAMMHAGGLRIDHVLGLKRLWLVPQELPASDGAFVTYPFEDLLNLIVLESNRHEAIVVGEDLGTVPEGFREQLAERGILGMSVLWFERSGDDGAFTFPGEWRTGSVALTTTHDLPTAAGWWAGRDIELRSRLGSQNDTCVMTERERDRAALRNIVVHLGPGSDGVEAAIEATAMSVCPLAIVPVEDLLGIVDQPNLPGTIDEHPNWRQRLQLRADEIFDDAAVVRRVEQLKRHRGSAGDESCRSE